MNMRVYALFNALIIIVNKIKMDKCRLKTYKANHNDIDINLNNNLDY